MSLSAPNINKSNSVNPIPVKGTSGADYIESTRSTAQAFKLLMVMIPFTMATETITK